MPALPASWETQRGRDAGALQNRGANSGHPGARAPSGKRPVARFGVFAFGS